VNRLANSENSYTFHGRDVYAYTGARLAAGIITFAQVGRELEPKVVSIDYQKPHFEQGHIYGNIEILDPQYGNIWTNIDRKTFALLEVKTGDEVTIRITNGKEDVLTQRLPYFSTFGQVDIGKPLLYLNSLNKVALAISQGNYSATYNIQSGASWSIEIFK